MVFLKCVYHLYEYIGGMHGGHYTAVSKVEEIVLQDIASFRHHCANASTPFTCHPQAATPATPASTATATATDALSLEEFISMNTATPLGTTGEQLLIYIF